MDQNRTLAMSAQLISAPRTSIAAMSPALSKVSVVLVSLVIFITTKSIMSWWEFCAGFSLQCDVKMAIRGILRAIYRKNKGAPKRLFLHPVENQLFTECKAHDVACDDVFHL